MTNFETGTLIGIETGGQVMTGGRVATSGTTGTGTSTSQDKPKESGGGCAMGGWLSAKALGPWLLAGLFGAMVMLARRRRR
jgi:hypothetical protein